MGLEHFYRYYRGKDGYSPRCKHCHNKAVKRYRSNIVAVPTKQKCCARCKETKPEESFCRSSLSRTGLSGWCKACQKQHREKKKETPKLLNDSWKPSLYREVFNRKSQSKSVDHRFREMLGRATFISIL